MKAIERDDAAPLWLDPIERRIIGAFRHREDAARVGFEQHLGRDVDQCGLAARHEKSFNRLGPLGSRGADHANADGTPARLIFRQRESWQMRVEVLVGGFDKAMLANNVELPRGL
jgi:hypothetical protein